ncbi:MAG TPA: hypothetical protein PLU73_02045 [Bacteroidia bacterium]|nr:hypothetical protein [Bacteroidia bacterium]
MRVAYLLIVLTISNLLKAQNIFAYSGAINSGFSGDGGLAINALLTGPTDVAVDAAGNVFIADCYNNRIRKVTPLGIISTYAGDGTQGFSGDGGSAINAQLFRPYGVATDANGNLYIADEYNNRIRKVNQSGIISTYGGNGVQGFSGDGGLAINARLNHPNSIVVDNLGNLYVCDRLNNRIRVISPSGIISTFAGTGIQGFNGDGGLAVNAEMNDPMGVTADSNGNVYITDKNNVRIRIVNNFGIISTFAGTGISGFNGDGGSATNAEFRNPTGLEFDASGNLYVVDTYNLRIRKINNLGIISTVAGFGSTGQGGNGGPATNAEFYRPYGVGTDLTGNIYIADANNVREICIGECLAGISTVSQIAYKIILYPNPCINTLHVQIDHQLNNGQFILLNSIGQKVYEEKIVKGTSEIKTNGFPIGLYNYILLQDNQTVKTGKLTIE